MFTGIDLLAFLVCAAVWLGPVIGNGLRGRWRLLHPVSIVPLVMIYMLVPALWYRLRGETIMKTSRLWAQDEWFLAEPILVLALCGLFYHLGVRLSGVSLRMKDIDDVDRCVGLELVRGVPTTAVLLACSAVVGMAVAMRVAVPTEDYSMGFYWMHLYFKSFQVAPLLVFHQDRKVGLLFLLLVLPIALLVRSKAAFLYIPIAFVLFYDRRLLSLSKGLTVSLIGLVLLTPVAVAMYGTTFSTSMDTAELDHLQVKGWEETLRHVSTREYALESFACVYRWRRDGGEPWHLGEMTGRQVLQMVPAALWPDKPLDFYDFPGRYLPRDFRELKAHYAAHIASHFFLDFDIPGACLGMMLLGVLFGCAYRLARQVALRRREAWPWAMLLTLALHAKYLVEGGLAAGLPNAIGMAAGVATMIGVAYALPRRSAAATAAQ